MPLTKLRYIKPFTKTELLEYAKLYFLHDGNVSQTSAGEIKVIWPDEHARLFATALKGIAIASTDE